MPLSENRYVSPAPPRAIPFSPAYARGPKKDVRGDRIRLWFDTLREDAAMTHDPEDVVKVYSGPLLTAEEYREALADAGIDSRLVGSSLSMAFEGVLPDLNELWVHRKDMEKAVAAIEAFEDGGADTERPAFPHPTSSPKPGEPPARKEGYVNPDPAGD
jgi:hypothetical protein